MGGHTFIYTLRGLESGFQEADMVWRASPHTFKKKKKSAKDIYIYILLDTKVTTIKLGLQVNVVTLDLDKTGMEKWEFFSSALSVEHLLMPGGWVAQCIEN